MWAVAEQPVSPTPLDYSCPREEGKPPDGWAQDLSEAAWGCFKLLVGLLAFVVFATVIWLVIYAINGGGW